MTDWKTVHAELQRLALEKAAYEADEAYWIREGHIAGVWRLAGYASYAEYLERMLGIERKTARERIRTALALGQLPEMSEALRAGRLSWTATRELTRVATPETEESWLEAAEGQSVRQVEAMVSGLAPGDLPGAPRDRGNERRVLRFEVSNATYAAFREAEKTLMKRTGQQLDDDELIGLVARELLAGSAIDSGDSGRSSYQLAYVKCPDCKRMFGQAAGGLVEGETGHTCRTTRHVGSGRAGRAGRDGLESESFAQLPERSV
jgi:hypothetical protein